MLPSLRLIGTAYQPPPNSSRHEFELADRPAGRNRPGGCNNRLGIDAVMTVQFGNGAGLAKMLDPEGAGAVTRHRSEPGERQRVPVDDRDQRAVCRHPVEQALDMAAGVDRPRLWRG